MVRRILHNPLALTGLAVLAIAVILAVFANWLAPHEPTQTALDRAFAPPGTAGYLLGTDDLGRDVLSRIMFGLRASLHVGVLAVAFSLVVGVPLGLIAGYFRPVDALISRLTDLVLAFPFLILAVGLAAIRGASLGNAAIAIGIAQIPGMIRIVRSETLRIKSLDFVAAAIVEGASDAWVLGRHILPERRLRDHRPGHRRLSRRRSSARPCCRSSASASSPPRRASARCSPTRSSSRPGRRGPR